MRVDMMAVWRNVARHNPAAAALADAGASQVWYSIYFGTGFARCCSLCLVLSDSIFPDNWCYAQRHTFCVSNMQDILLGLNKAAYFVCNNAPHKSFTFAVSKIRSLECVFFCDFIDPIQLTAKEAPK